MVSESFQPNVFDDAVPYHLDSARKACAALRVANELAAARADEANARAEQCAAEAAGQARQAVWRLAAARAGNHKLQLQLAHLRSEAGASRRHTLAVQAWAAQLERHLLAMRDSTSWKVTAPLRLAGSIPRRAASALQRMRSARIMQRMRAALRLAVLRASASERLRRLLIPVLLRFPGQLSRISRLLASVRQPDPAPAASSADMPDALRAMPAKARRVLADLRRARGGPGQG